jgi:hypothetical protein
MSELAPQKLSTSDFADILHASYLPQSKAADYMSSRGFNYDKDLSTMESKVFVNKETGAPLIASRGSTRVSDFLYEDPRLITFAGQFFDTRRVSDIKNLSKATQEKYGMAPTLTGHSLGAYLAEKGAQATPGSDVYTYNRAVGLPSIFTSVPSNQYNYRTTLDPVSALSVFQSDKNKKTLAGSYNPIASHYLDYLK